MQETNLMNLERLLYGRRDSARALGISVRKFDQLVAEKIIPIRRIGRRVLVTRDALQKFAKVK